MKKQTGIVAAVLGLVLVLAACEKEGIEAGAGGKVALTISVNNGEYVAEAGGLKNFNTKTNETALERVAIPLGDNEDYYLSATLKEDTEQPQGELRGAPSNGQRITLVAFDASNDAQVGSANYYYSTGASDLIPQTAGSPLVVDVNKNYYIVAYSYNSTTENPAVANIDPWKDLLWGKSDPKTITFTDRTVEINMAHKFSRVKVNISAANVAGASITSIGTVTVEGSKRANLTIRTGGVAPVGSVIVRDFTATLTGSGATRETGYYVFYPSPTKVNISAITLTIASVPKPFTTLSADFTKVLEAGKSYILAVDLAKVGWATSNIYWDGSRLTFDKYPVGSHPTYQGVFFKHGSLIGISPAGITTAQADPNIILYVPPVRGESAWTTTTVSTSNAWGSDFASIPNLNGRDYASTSDNYLHDQINDPSTHYYNYYGDICSYLTGGTWRMPNVDEFGVTANYTGSSQASSTNPQDATGKGVISNGLTYNTGSETVFFPYSGQRNESGRLLNDGIDKTGHHPFYLSGSAYPPIGSSLTIVTGLIYDTSVINPKGGLVARWAHSVRCIKI